LRFHSKSDPIIFSGTDPGFLITRGTDLENVFGVTKKVLKKSFPSVTPTPLQILEGALSGLLGFLREEYKNLY